MKLDQQHKLDAVGQPGIVTKFLRSLYASLRARLVLLALLALLPAFGLALYGDLEQHRLATQQEQDNALRLANIAADNQSQLIDAADHQLIALAQAPQVLSRNSTACNALFAGVLQQHPNYVNLGAADPSGNVFCSAVPIQSPVNIADRTFFQRALQTRAFSIGGYQVGQITGAPVLHTSLPVLDEAGNVRAVIYISLSLDWFSRLASNAALPSGSTFDVTDRNLTILARYPNPAEWVGKSLPAALGRQLPQGEGTAEAVGADGVARLYAFTSVRDAAQAPVLYVSVGIPTSVAYAQVDQAFARNLIGLGLVTLLAMIAAWIVGDIFIVRRVTALSDVASQLAAGNLRVRSGPSYEISELGQLERRLDEMAAALQKRELERAESDATMRNWMQVLENTQVGIVITGPDADAMDMINPAFARMHGYTVEELFGRPFQTVLAAESYPQIDELIRILREQTQYVFESQNQRKDGTLFPSLIQVTSVRNAKGELDYFIVNVQDLSELRRVQAAERDQRALADALRDTTAALTSTLNFNQVLKRILDNVGRVVPHDAADMMLIESDAARPVGCRGYAQHGVEDWFMAQRFPIAKFARMRRMLETGHSVLVADTKNDPTWVDLLETRWIRSVIGAPIRVREQVIGFLNLSSVTPGFFDETHLARLETFANQAAIALENARLLADSEKRANEFAVLYQITLDLATHLDLPTLLQTIVERAVKMFSASGGGMYLYDAARGDLVVTVATHPWTPLGTRLRMGEGMAGRVAQTRQPLIVNDYRTWRLRAPQFEGTPLSAVIEVPMLSGGELIGVLVVEEFGETTRQFTEEDARLLSLFAAHVAGAAHNARLLQEARSRAEQLGLLYDAGLALNSVLDSHAQLEFLLKIAMRALNAERAEFFRYDASLDQLSFELNIGYGDAHSAEAAARLRFSAADEQLVAWVARQRTPLNVGDVQADSRWILIDPEIRSGLWAPIQHENQLRGILGVLSTRLNAFTPQDERLIVLFANQVAVAMENARLFEAQSKRTAELEALRQASLHVTSTLDLRQVLNQIIEHALKLVNASDTHIFLYDGERLTFGAAIFAGGAQDRAIEEPRSQGITYTVARQGASIVVPDTLHHPLFQDRPWSGAIASFPLKIGGQVRGVMNVAFAQPRAFDADELRVLELLADQAAVALENARLFDETRHRLAELEAVAKLSTALRQAQTVDEMVPLLLDELLAALDTNAGELALYDASSDELRVLATRGWFAETPQVSPADDGVAGQVFRSGQSRVVREFLTDPQTSELARPAVPAGWGGAVVPIRTAQEVIGVLDVAVPLPRVLTADEVRLLNTLTEIAGNSIHRAALHQQTEQRLQRLDALHVIDIAISASLDLRVTLNVLLDQIISQLRVDAADVLLLNPQTQMLEYSAGRGFRTMAAERARVRIGQDYAGRAALERRLIQIPNLHAADAAAKIPERIEGEGFFAYYAAPLIAKGQLKGVLEIFHRARLDHDAEWLDFIETLAGQTAIAVDNAALFDGLQRSNFDISLAYDATLEGWARSLDLRDPETGSRTERVTDLAVTLARAMGMRGEDLAHVRRGALLHDIGKIAIPDRVLLKRDPLTPPEEEILRQHPTIANELLSPIAYLQPAVDIPYCHHERWDGKGYPRGLKGDQIPLSARIFAVADAWDGLLTARTSRPALTVEQARQQLHEQSGNCLDPAIVQVFLKIIDEPYYNP